MQILVTILLPNPINYFSTAACNSKPVAKKNHSSIAPSNRKLTAKTKLLQYCTFNNKPAARNICTEKYISCRSTCLDSKMVQVFKLHYLQKVPLELPISCCFIWMSSGLKMPLVLELQTSNIKHHLLYRCRYLIWHSCSQF